MAFKIDDIIFDSIDVAYAEDSLGNPLYVLSQLSEATVDITGESTESRDKNGSLIKRTWKGKSGTFSATNAMLNLSAIGAMSGSGKTEASAGKPIYQPKILTVKAGSTVTLKGYDAEKANVKVSAYGNNGAMNSSKKYTLAVSPSATEFSITSGGVLTPPTDEAETLYIIKYTKKVETGIAIENRADKFPQTVKLTLKALCYDPCTPSVLRGCYVEIPSFQVSPELSISFTSEGTINYTGDLQVDYCSEDKALYRIFMDDEEE